MLRSLVFWSTRPKSALLGSTTTPDWVAGAAPGPTLPPVGSPRFGVVDEVERLQAELDAPRSAEGNVLEERDVQLWKPGARRPLGFRPPDPKVPAAGRAKAAGLNQKFWSTARPFENCGLSMAGSPTRL
jgi:hypothetical protein